MKNTTNKNGLNIFGDPCVSKSIFLKRETAFEQCVQAVYSLMNEHDVEYTFIPPKDFSTEEYNALMRKVELYMSIASVTSSKPILHCGM